MGVKPKLFIGCSKRVIELARALASKVEGFVEPIEWTHPGGIPWHEVDAGRSTQTCQRMPLCGRVLDKRGHGPVEGHKLR